MIVEAKLARPLGSRQLIDGADAGGGPRQVFDGKLVLWPAALPHGWSRSYEDVVDVAALGDRKLGWVQVFSPPPLVVVGACATTEHSLWLFTNDFPPTFPPNVPPAETVLVRGHPAALVHTGQSEEVSLSWNEGGTSYELRSRQSCANGARADVDLMVRVAQSLG